ncbi:NUDIX domain-containing protein [Lentzea sp. NPDC004789]
MARPGCGTRHPVPAGLLASHRPAATREIAWLGGAMPLRVGAHPGPAGLPEELVTSVRCVVLVDGLVVLCENADGVHPLPGGRREPGESYVDTAAREVHEETGWLLDRDTVRPLGWLHLEHLAPRRPDDAGPIRTSSRSSSTAPRPSGTADLTPSGPTRRGTSSTPGRSVSPRHER